MILGLQLIAVLFVLVMIYVSYLHYRKGDLNGVEMLFLLIAWFGAIAITLFPEFFHLFSQTIAISRAFDLGVLGGFVFLIPLIYISYVRTKKIEKKIDDFIRKEALKDLKSESKKK